LSHGVDCTEKSAPAATAIETLPPFAALLITDNMSTFVSSHSRDAFAPVATMNATLDLEQYLELLLGPKNDISAFGSDESRHDAWREHAAALLTLVDPGSRPWAWWQYDATEPMLPREPEIAYLARCGFLTDTERERLERARLQLPSLATRNP